MTNAELIAALRYCGNSQKTGCKGCPLWDKPMDACFQIVTAAADALEADDKRIAELEAQMSKIKSQIYDLESMAKREYDDDPDNEYFEGYFDGLHQAAKLISACGARMKGEHDERTES